MNHPRAYIREGPQSEIRFMKVETREKLYAVFTSSVLPRWRSLASKHTSWSSRYKLFASELLNHQELLSLMFPIEDRIGMDK